MSRRPFIAGNWKMHKTASETGPFLRRLTPRLPGRVDVAVCVPFTSLAAAVDAARGSALKVYAQNMHQAPQGAFTGEVSAAMLLDLGVDGVLLGHSERRQYFNETDRALGEKVGTALDAGLEVILAVGETAQERESGATNDVLARQVTLACDPVRGRSITIAYEPVWAIGTGRTATPQMAQDAHAFIRSLLPNGPDIRIQYGGSMKPDNAAELLAQPEVDGGLIGGACLEVESFVAILEAAA